MRRKRLLITALALVIAVAGSGLAYAHFHGQDKPTADTAAADETGSTNSGDINFDGPTEADKKSNDEHKDELSGSQQPATEPDTQPSQKQVKVLIAYANKTGIGAYATGVFEDGGTCTATIKQGSQTITKTSTGFQNASYTQCTPINPADSNLDTSQPWTVTVRYSSANADGVSEKTTVQP